MVFVIDVKLGGRELVLDLVVLVLSVVFEVNSLVVEFFLIDFFVLECNCYVFKFEGYDGDWVFIDVVCWVVVYVNLLLGYYCLWLCVFNCDG